MSMKEQIEKAIEYLKKVSIKEPIDIRVEEIETGRIVLSFETDDSSYLYSKRIYKEFNFNKELGDSSIKSMISFNLK